MQDYVNLEIKKKSGLSLNPDIHHSKVPSSVFLHTGLPPTDESVIYRSQGYIKGTVSAI